MTDRDDYKQDLRSANIARQKEWDAFDQLTLAYRGNDLAGEVGEACNVIKELERERLGIAGSRDTIAHLAEELADVIICTDLIAMQADIDLDAAVVAKFNASSEKVGLKTRLRAASVKAGEVVAWPGQLFDLLGAKRIMLVCQSCEQNNPEGCGHFTADTLRLSRDGSFVCESCWDDLGDELRWIDLPTITAAPDRSALVVEPVKGEPVAHRKMTREEYNALNLNGWHSVRHDEECEGVTEVSYTAPTTPERP